MRIYCCTRDLVKRYALLFLMFSFFGCGVSDEQYNTLKNENLALQARIDTLTNEVNDLKFGAEALLKKARLKINAGEYQAAKELLTTITDKYYNSNEALTARNLIIEVIPKIEESDFVTASNDPGTSLLESHIQQYPNGRFLSTAQQLLEERHWQLAKNNNRAADLQSFITKYPNSSHLTEANELLIKSEVGEVFNGKYNSLPPLRKDYNAFGDGEGSVHKVDNLTSSRLLFYIAGPSSGG
jgi:TolA-binding protein